MTGISRRFARLAACVLAAGGALAVSGCQRPAAEGIGFREARFNDMAAITDWRKCRDEAVDLDHQAHDEASSARYLAAARLMEKCESDLGEGATKVTADERMHAYALGVQDYLKGGDVPKARETLEKLKMAFPGSDLYYGNGASFIDTMDFLTGVRDRATVGVLGVANVDSGFESEMRRDQYWKHN